MVNCGSVSTNQLYPSILASRNLLECRLNLSPLHQPQPSWQNHPRSPVDNSAGQCAANCPAKSRPCIRSYRRRCRTLRQGSIAVRERLGSYQRDGPRDARPLALECSCDSIPNRCPPSVVTAFPKAFEARRSNSGPRSVARPYLLSSSVCRPLPEGRTR
jgi:hypothetical protein